MEAAVCNALTAELRCIDPVNLHEQDIATWTCVYETLRDIMLFAQSMERTGKAPPIAKLDEASDLLDLHLAAFRSCLKANSKPESTWPTWVKGHDTILALAIEYQIHSYVEHKFRGMDRAATRSKAGRPYIDYALRGETPSLRMVSFLLHKGAEPSDTYHSRYSAWELCLKHLEQCTAYEKQEYSREERDTDFEVIKLLLTHRSGASVSSLYTSDDFKDGHFDESNDYQVNPEQLFTKKFTAQQSDELLALFRQNVINRQDVVKGRLKRKIKGLFGPRTDVSTA